MKKQEFLDRIAERLSDLPRKEVLDRLAFYSEMIDDRIEEGCTEETAVSEIGSVDQIVAQIIADIPLSKIVKETIKPKRRLKTWEIVLLSVGSPIWFSLLIAAFAVALSLYLSLWSIIVSIWAVFASLIACAFAGLLVGGIFAFGGKGAAGMALIAAGLMCAGLSIFLFFACRAATNGTLLLTKKMALGIKRFFIKKENA